MRVYIAEKPSVARAIAQFMGGKAISKQGYIEHSSGDVITYCAGHFYELAPPGYYNGGQKGFSFSYLPLLPTDWKVLLKDTAKAQVRVIQGLLKGATEVIHAGDPDREGQLIVDELLTDLKCRLPVRRLWLSANDETSVKRALASIKDNSGYLPMGYAAMARQRADWLVGMNLSPSYTLAAQKSGFRGLISIGRVQTPTLALVVKRCMEIENFKPQDYFSISAQIKVAQGEFVARYKVDDSLPGVDAEGRVATKQLADLLVNRVKGAVGTIAECKTERKKEGPPLGFSLSALTILANRRFGYGAQQVLDVCQELYDPSLALLSYPRTDCEYLPDSHHNDASNILAHLAANFPEAQKANSAQKSRIFNDKKVTAHHAIVPTLKPANLAVLSQAQRSIYELVCKQYIAQFFPDFVYDKTSVVVNYPHQAGIDVFTASGRVELQQGWRDVLAQKAKADDDESTLPQITPGENAKALDVEAKLKQTEPPKYHTEGTLLDAMTNVHKEVTDPEIKKRLKENDGIGTEATRASIINTLFKREFMVMDKKFIKDTKTGRDLILAIPNIIKDPGMTALWENALRSIEAGTMTIDHFIGMQSKSLTKLVEQAKTLTINITSTKSEIARTKPVKDCPKCGKPMREMLAKQGKNAGNKFLGCTGYPNCKHTEQIVGANAKRGTTSKSSYSRTATKGSRSTATQGKTA
ncbi:DNA topoisomerase 3 [Methylobacillus sp. Pita2]|uniref:DNA topoisomerase 3 n=1 Tax=Methylobacillus sp. Pita2 TaxID=3383245 RepID=UPI0038B56851